MATRLRVDVGNKLKLGLFPPNVSGGMTPTTVPERWDPTWDNNAQLAKLADEAGLEFLLPAARWIGFGGNTAFQDKVFECLTWATAVLARTERITVFSTVHVPLINPIFAGMQMATADQVGHGRFGLNLVCGWRPDEFAMFGVGLENGSNLYEMGEEWLTVVRRLWTTEERFDYQGQFYRLMGVTGKPKPYGGSQPVVMNAGSSPRGRAFAVQNCDFLFTTLFEADDKTRKEISDFKTRAVELRRTVGVCVCAYVVCRPTQKEAEEYHYYYSQEHADWTAVDELLKTMGTKVAPERLEAFRAHLAGGAGLYPIIGGPDEVADELARLHEIGFDGAALGWVNYLDDLPYFRDEILPRLEARGLRGPA